jgi:hypothetical protein
VHCSVGSASVLLNAQFNALLGDTGQAQVADTEAVFTRGTRGEPWHMDPEVRRTGKVQVTSDVFALGALLEELLCGRLAVDTVGDACQKVPTCVYSGTASVCVWSLTDASCVVVSSVLVDSFLRAAAVHSTADLPAACLIGMASLNH